MDLADSLTLDGEPTSFEQQLTSGHKWLNVPYDCGLFFTKSPTALSDVLGPGDDAPAYLASKSELPSPLYVNIENSRRFRALPLLAGLVSLGRDGYVGECSSRKARNTPGRKLTADIFRRNCASALQVAAFLDAHPAYELLNKQAGEFIVPLNIVLFAEAEGKGASSDLAERINWTRRMYVSGTAWRGRRAVRLAVSNWRTGEEDLEVVMDVLNEVAKK